MFNDDEIIEALGEPINMSQSELATAALDAAVNLYGGLVTASQGPAIVARIIGDANNKGAADLFLEWLKANSVEDKGSLQ